MRGIVRAILSAVILCSVSAAHAQAPAVSRLRGTLSAIDGRVLTVHTREGETVKVALADSATLVAPKSLQLSDIKPGSFIGTAAVVDGAGLKSLEVVVFPEAMRGTGEGHYDWDLTPGSSMTNANVDAVVEGTNGREMKLSYKGGSISITVPAGAPIVTPVPAALDDFKPGVAVFVAATKGADGGFIASRAWVGREGVAPPM